MSTSIRAKAKPSVRGLAREKGISRYAAEKMMNTLPDGYETNIVFFDTHGKHRDPGVINTIDAVSQDLQPKRVIAGGDIATCAWASKIYGAECEDMAKEEADDVSALLKRLSVTDYIMGNHEERCTREGGSIDPRFRSILNIPNLCELDEKGINWYPYKSDAEPLRLGKLSIIHGWYYNEHCAAKHARNLGCVMHGHAHRCQTWSGGVGGKASTGISVGCCCDTTLPFEQGKPPRGHMQAFAIVWTHPDGHFDYHVVRIVGPEVIVNGKLYRVQR